VASTDARGPLVAISQNFPAGAAWTTTGDSTAVRNVDSVYFQTTHPGSGTNGGSSRTLRSSFFGFDGSAYSALANAEIVGIEVRLTFGAMSASIVDSVVQLAKGTSPDMNGTAAERVGVNRATASTIASSEVRTYGGPTDLWGATWTAAEIRSSGFAVDFVTRNTSTSTTRIARIDQVAVTIYYRVVAIAGLAFTAADDIPVFAATAVVTGAALLSANDDRLAASSQPQTAAAFADADVQVGDDALAASALTVARASMSATQRDDTLLSAARVSVSLAFGFTTDDDMLQSMAGTLAPVAPIIPTTFYELGPASVTFTEIGPAAAEL
jgi:hypothetical protein